MTVANDVQAAERLDVPGTPDVPGLTFRRFGGEGDFPRMLGVVAACAAADHFERVQTLEEVRKDYADLFNSDPTTDMIFAEVDGEVVAYGRVLWWEELTRRLYFHFAYVHPAWRERGILPAMVGWQEDRLREIAAGHESDRPRFFVTGSDSNQPQKNAVYEGLGFRPQAFTALMVRPDLENIPDAPLPAGFEVRPATEDQFRAIYEAEMAHFRDHVNFVEPSDEHYRRYFLGERGFNPSLWHVAWHEDEIAGMLRAFVDENENADRGRKRGYTENISVAKPYRRRGLARALLGRSLRQMKTIGMDEAALTVHTENPNQAMSLYESMGFREIKREIRYEKPMD